MQRQSLGIPASKLQNDGGAEEVTIKIEEQRKNEENSSSSRSSFVEYFDEDDQKPRLSRSSDPLPEFNKYIHLIPVVVFLSLLCLFLFSHDPSQSELAMIGLKPLHKQLDSTAVTEDIGLHIQPARDDGVKIQSPRNLKSKSTALENHSPKYRRHRKVADF